MTYFKFEIGQVLEMVRGQKEDDYIANVIRRFVKNESVVKELVALNTNQDGDLFKVCERRLKTDKNNVVHDLYLCQNLKTQEFTLFGQSGLREHIPIADCPIIV